MSDEVVVLDGGYDFRLLRRGERLVLGVLCGTSAMYELKVPLTLEEEAQFQREGEDFARRLSRRVSKHPEQFSDRPA